MCGCIVFRVQLDTREEQRLGYERVKKKKVLTFFFFFFRYVSFLDPSY